MESSASFFGKFLKTVRRPVFWVLPAAAAVFAWLFFFVFPAPDNFPPNTLYKVAEGSSLEKISADLYDLHLIRSRSAFEFFVTLSGGDRRIKDGYYLFDRKTPVYNISLRLAMGDRHLVPEKITIPEGTNLKQIAEIFSAKLPNFDKTKFLAEASDKEGYLFPDTYFFFSPDTEEDVLRAMEENFSKRISSLLPAIKSSGHSEGDIIIMASLLEKEAKGKEDRPIISGILWKRLSMGMPLQADVAPGTYKRKGLPSEPIGNPGLGSIKDAIYPESSPYLYYLHDKEGIAHFAATFSEHEANIRKYLK